MGSLYPKQSILICMSVVKGCNLGNYDHDCPKNCNHCNDKSSCGAASGKCNDKGCAFPGFKKPLCQSEYNL